MKNAELPIPTEAANIWGKLVLPYQKFKFKT
jgi:hypothetical protein